MPRPFPPLTVDPADIVVLQRWRRELPPESPLARRACVVLLAEEGVGTSAAARELRCSKHTVTVWRERYRTDGIDGLIDAPRPGRPASVDPVTVLLRTLADPGAGRARWSTRTLAADLGISNAAVASQWRYWGVRPEAGGHISLLTEPVLDAPVAAVEGLLVHPRLRVLAVAVDTGEPSRGPRPAVVAPEDVGDLVADLLSRPDGRTEDLDALTGFLDRLEEVKPPPGRRLELIVDGDPEQIGGPLARSVHGVPAGRSWLQVVRAGCFAVGARGDAASVDALLAGAPAGHSWIRFAQTPGR